MSLKTALENSHNLHQRNDLFRSLFDFKDVMEKMKPGIKKVSIQRMWRELYSGVVSLDNRDWWIEGGRSDDDTDFLRDEQKDEIRLSAEMGREFGREGK